MGGIAICYSLGVRLEYSVRVVPPPQHTSLGAYQTHNDGHYDFAAAILLLHQFSNVNGDDVL